MHDSSGREGNWTAQRRDCVIESSKERSSRCDDIRCVILLDTNRSSSMGQNVSVEEGAGNDQRRPDEHSEEPSPGHQKRRSKHQFYISNGDLETVGDLDSILQAIKVSPSPSESGGAFRKHGVIRREHTNVQRSGGSR